MSKERKKPPPLYAPNFLVSMVRILGIVILAVGIYSAIRYMDP